MILRPTPTRRRLLQAAMTVPLAAPLIWTRRAIAAQQLVVRTPGGVFDEVKKKTVYDPFREATGIEIVPAASTAAKLLAMFKAGQVDIDVIDTGDDVLLDLEHAGALEPLPYKEFKYTNPDDIDPSVRSTYQVGSFVYAFVNGFNTTAFAVGKEPMNWEQFWDVKAFPGPRTLADMASGAPNLELALIADGVPVDKVYPIDIDRAFKSLSRIKASVPKFWDTGALSAQMLANKDAVLAVIWSTRVQVAADGGAKVAAQWAQNQVLAQAYGITKGTPKMAEGVKFIDYSLSPEVQARWLGAYKAIPVNQKAYPHTAPQLMDPATNVPWTKSKGFRNDIRWWSDNRAKVSTYWNKWVLQ
ncbi:MAG TPA: ABC transporter substrate-binding protein [Acetobacteraceae bacterium]|jgi:putative spermidine/putrescine transport system substrate-binding protein|nr:ABC transporter substrate-binding protein [Acetobacteraceae bacterium]